MTKDKGIAQDHDPPARAALLGLPPKAIVIDRDENDLRGFALDAHGFDRIRQIPKPQQRIPLFLFEGLRMKKQQHGFEENQRGEQ